MFDGARYVLQMGVWGIFSLAGWLSQITHTLWELFLAHKILSLLSVGCRHRREPGLSGLWRILLVLQDDFHSQRPLSDNDLLQQSEGSHGSSRPCTLSGKWTEGTRKCQKNECRSFTLGGNVPILCAYNFKVILLAIFTKSKPPLFMV